MFAADINVEGNRPATFTRTFEAGSYLIEARERDIDLKVVVYCSGVQQQLEDEVPRHGLHATVVRLERAMPLRIELHSADHPSKHGVGSLRISRWDPRSAPRSDTERGEELLGVAGMETALGNPGAWNKAAQALQEAAERFHVAHDDAAEAQALYTLGHLQYLVRDDRPAAIRAAIAAAAKYRELDDLTGVHRAAILRAASELEIAAGMNAGTQGAEQRALYAAADKVLATAADYFAAHDLAVSAEYAVNMRGVAAVYVGDYEHARELLARAAEMSRANDDAREQITSLSNLAWVEKQLGFVAEAAAQYARLLPLLERERNPSLYGAIRHNYGLCLIELGEFDRALEMQTESLQIARDSGQELEQGRLHEAMGGLYLLTGDLQNARDMTRAGIELQERIGDGIGLVGDLRLAANIASALGNHLLALDYLRRALQFDNNPVGVARTHLLIAGEQRLVGKLSAAASEITLALASQNELVQAQALDERGRLALAQRNVSAAVADLRTADQRFARLGLDFNRMDTNTALSKALLANGDAAGAVAAADVAIAIVRRLRVNSANPEWRARFLSARYAPFEARIAAELAGADQAAASWQAFRTAEEVRGRSLAERLRIFAARSRPADATDDALRVQFTAQQLRLEAGMQRQDVDQAAIAALRRAVDKTRARIDARRTVMTEKELELPASLRQLQERIPPDTAVLAYFVGEDESHGWLLTPTALRHERLPALASLRRTIASLRAPRNAPPDAVALQEMSRTVLGALLRQVSARRLLVLPDGPLHGVPFAALPMPDGRPQELLVDHFSIASASSLALAIESPSSPRSAVTSLVVVVSDPVYATNDRRLSQFQQNAVGNRGASNEHEFARLPYSAVEARAVVTAFNDRQVVALAGFDATARRVLDLSAERLAVLHFATHAITRRESPAQSALYLSQFSANGTRIVKDRLTADDIARSALHADVVVLSGCATGDGAELRGEGVLGLAYAFLANGSHSVVVSLWPVEDALTARFMEEFYSAYRTTGRASDALRIAQLRTRSTAASSVWSSFVVRTNGLP